MPPTRPQCSKNALALRWRSACGAAQKRLANGGVLHHATLSYDIDGQVMTEVLRIGREGKEASPHDVLARGRQVLALNLREPSLSLAAVGGLGALFGLAMLFGRRG